MSVKKIVYGTMVMTLLWVGYLFASHRISVESMFLVNKGYVNRGGRYRKIIDKKTSLEYLKPMLGKAWLPVAPFKAFQKVDGAAIFGAIRTATYIFSGSLPSIALLPDGSIYEFNIRRWLYMRERYKITKEMKKKDILIFLNIYLPVIILFSTIVFFCLLVFLEIKLNWALSARFHEITELILHKYGG